MSETPVKERHQEADAEKSFDCSSDIMIETELFACADKSEWGIARTKK